MARKTEIDLSRAATIIALICVLVVGAAAATILGSGSVPMAEATADAPAQAMISNWEHKSDRLAVAVAAPAAPDPLPTATIASEPIRQAFAAAPPQEIDGLKIEDTGSLRAPPPKPKSAAKPVQKSYTLLSDAQIASIKERLKLSPSQESYWPAVETALRAVARKIHATRQSDPNSASAPVIDPEAEEVQQLKSAAMPLLFQLREDQKREVRTLARLIGLEKVAAAI